MKDKRLRRLVVMLAIALIALIAFSPAFAHWLRGVAALLAGGG